MPVRCPQEDADFELGMALSVSSEEERLRRPVIISTQEYVEDERRRRELLHDKSKDMFDSSVEEGTSMEEVRSLEVARSLVEVTSVDEVERESVGLKTMWVGEKEERIPMTSNSNVGRRPKPTVLVQIANQTASESRMITSFVDKNQRFINKLVYLLFLPDFCSQDHSNLGPGRRLLDHQPSDPDQACQGP